MFLGFLGKLFSNSQLIEEYANVLFDEFLANNNAKAAWIKRRNLRDETICLSAR